MPRTIKVSKNLPSDFDSLVRFHMPRVIRDEVDYQNVQEILDVLTSIPKLSKGQEEYLETLSILFSDYERKMHAIETDDLGPIDMLRHFMDQQNMTASDLGRLLGDRTLGAKIVGGTRDLSKAHIMMLAAHFGVSAAVFI